MTKLRALTGLLGVVTAGVMLAGCAGNSEYAGSGKATRPISSETMALMEKKGMRPSDPILVRIFKKEKELEVWKRDKSGKYAHLKTYPICAVGGVPGPKVKEGDYQSPEGFYTVAPSQMNPNSQFHLAYNIGYPNKLDQAYGRTGSAIMVHGACSSSGCFAMTDPQIEDIYALSREAFRGGQPSFQVQSYPFRMTARNFAEHRKSPHLAFWKNLKNGHDQFEVTKLEPKVDVCEKRYVFNAQTTDPSSTVFNAAGACPTYQVPQHITAAVEQLEKSFEAEKMTVIAALEEQERTQIADKLATRLAALKSGPQPGVFASAQTPIPGRTETTAVAAAPGATAPASGGMFGSLFAFGAREEAPAGAALAAAPTGTPLPAARPAAPAASGGYQLASGPRAATPTTTVRPVATPVPAPAAAAPAPVPAEAAKAGDEPSWWQKLNPFAETPAKGDKAAARPVTPGPQAAAAPRDAESFAPLDPRFAAPTVRLPPAALGYAAELPR